LVAAFVLPPRGFPRFAGRTVIEWGLVSVANPARSPLTTANAGCVVLNAAGGDLPRTLQEWLESRGGEEHVVDHPLRAMAALCLMERGQASRAAWGLERITRLALVIRAERDEMDRVCHALIAAVRRFVPAGSIWVFERGDVRLIHGEEHEASESAPSAEPPIALPAIPIAPGRITLAAAVESSAPRPTRATPPDQAVTRDEIAMLLDELDEQEPRP